MISVNIIRDKSFMIINNIAFLIVKKESQKFVRVYDLNNLKYVADFYFDTGINRFSIARSTFSEGKRKYEMLYLVERNKEEIFEVFSNAKVFGI